MGLQEQIADAIIIAFDELGGDPRNAVEAAVRHTTVESWLNNETTQTALAGGGEMLIPGLHALTIPAGISLLLHKMARVSWGIGAIKGRYVVETSQYSDLRNILALWANGEYFNAHIIDYLSIEMKTFEYALTSEGYRFIEEQIKRDELNNVLKKSLLTLRRLAQEFGGDERAQNIVRLTTGRGDLSHMVMTAREAIPAAEPRSQLNSRISARLALQLSTHISMRVPARLVMGFVPLAGPLINAFFNAQTLRSMAKSAEKYYERALTVETIQEAAKPSA